MEIESTDTKESTQLHYKFKNAVQQIRFSRLAEDFQQLKQEIQQEEKLKEEKEKQRKASWLQQNLPKKSQIFKKVANSRELFPEPPIPLISTLNNSVDLNQSTVAFDGTKELFKVLFFSKVGSIST